MEIRYLDEIIVNEETKLDSLDIPECFGEYNKSNKLCAQYCSISIRCCILHQNNPKVDILEKLLVHNQFAIKMH